MKKLFILIIVSCKIVAHGQILIPAILSTAGTSFNNGSTTWDFTLGEPATFTFNNSTNQLSQGFHQNDLLITEVDNLENNFGVSLFPNPTAEFVQIQFEKITDNNLLELFSADGKLVFSEKINAVNSSQINMSKYSNGTYLLKITRNDKEKSYRIIKN